MIGRLIQLIRRLLTPSKIRAGVAAARRGYTAFRRWYDDLPWLVRVALGPFGLEVVWEVFKNHL